MIVSPNLGYCKGAVPWLLLNKIKYNENGGKYLMLLSKVYFISFFVY